MVCSIQRKEVIMKSSKIESQLDDFLEDYVLENLDRPESREELDQFLLAHGGEQIESNSETRVERVLSQIAKSSDPSNTTSEDERQLQLVFFEKRTGRLLNGRGSRSVSQTL